MPTASSRIWTRITEFISYDDNRYTPNSSKKSFAFFEFKYKYIQTDP